MMTGTLESFAGTHIEMQYGDRNCRESCWHIHCNEGCVLPFKLRCLLCRYVLNATATWLWTFFGGLLLWTGETQITTPLCHINTAVMWQVTLVLSNVLQCQCVSTHQKKILHFCQVTSCLLCLWTRTGCPWPTGELLQWIRKFHHLQTIITGANWNNAGKTVAKHFFLFFQCS